MLNKNVWGHFDTPKFKIWSICHLTKFQCLSGAVRWLLSAWPCLVFFRIFAFIYLFIYLFIHIFDFFVWFYILLITVFQFYFSQIFLSNFFTRTIWLKQNSFPEKVLWLVSVIIFLLKKYFSFWLAFFLKKWSETMIHEKMRLK